MASNPVGFLYLVREGNQFRAQLGGIPEQQNFYPISSGGLGSPARKSIAINKMIAVASQHGGTSILLPGQLLDYDPTTVNFSTSVKMLREGQIWDMYDVKAYGAKGDGPGGTDDLAAINAAAAAANAQGGSLIWHPPGVYTVSTDPTFPGSTEPIGDSASYDGSATIITGLLQATSLAVSGLTGGANGQHVQWTSGAAAWVDSVLDKGGAVFNIKHPDFGAAGDGITDDTAAIQAAIDAAEAVAGVVYVPGVASGYLVSSDLTMDSECGIMGRGRLVVDDGATITNAILNITAQYGFLDGILVDFSGVSSTTGDAVGIRVTSQDVVLENPRVFGPGETQAGVGGGNANCIEILGDRCRINNPYTKDSRYYGILITGDFCEIRGAVCMGGRRGIGFNGTATKFTVVGGRLYTNSSEADSNNFNVNATSLAHLDVRGLSSEQAQNLQAMKLTNVAKADLVGCNFDGEVQFASGLGQIAFEESAVSGKIQFGASTVDGLYLENVSFITGGSYCLDQCQVTNLRCERVTASGFTGAFLDNDLASASIGRAIFLDCDFEGNNATDVYLWNDGDGDISESGKVVVLGSTITNAGAGAGDWHANDDRNRLFKTLDFSATVYRAGSVPTATGITWNTADRIMDGTPSAGGKIGWVSTSGGGPGVWKPFGAIDA